MPVKKNKPLRVAYQVLVHLLAIFGIIFIALIAYWWPVIDRLAIRPCHYYPHAFADCVNKGE
jgi:hypothetical protein